MNTGKVFIDTLEAEPPQGGYHSATPWTIRQEGNDALVIVDANGNDTTILADIQHEPSVGINGDPEGAHNDMRRIVACVNAFQGIRTEFIEKTFAVEGIPLLATNDTLLQRCDELLKALKRIQMQAYSDAPCEELEDAQRDLRKVHEIARMAIAKAEAETNPSAVPTQPN